VEFCAVCSEIQVGEAGVKMSLYADDAVLMAESAEELQVMLKKIGIEYKKNGSQN
jgi:hypothetical protein